VVPVLSAAGRLAEFAANLRKSRPNRAKEPGPVFTPIQGRGFKIRHGEITPNSPVSLVNVKFLAYTTIKKRIFRGFKKN
jgi:hypothetical protein